MSILIFNLVHQAFLWIVNLLTQNMCMLDSVHYAEIQLSRIYAFNVATLSFCRVVQIRILIFADYHTLKGGSREKELLA